MSQPSDDFESEMLVNAADNAMEQKRREMYPPYNTETEILEEVYPLSSLIPEPVFNALGEMYDSRLDECEEEYDGIFYFVYLIKLFSIWINNYFILRIIVL